jgi:hypothetical protein
LDVIKGVGLFFLYCVFAPVVGVLIRNKRHWQRLIFFAMCFMTIGGFLQAAEWGVTMHPILYRGTARGFHFFWAEVAAMALIVASMAGDWRNFKFTPRGMRLYLFYCLVSFISIVNAPEPLYVWFAAVKAVKMIVIFIAAYNFLKTEEDLRYFLTCMAVTIFWELFAVLKLKYMDHIYQVYGTFEHQNSLSMFATLIGMVFLAAALGPKQPRVNFFLFAYFCCAAIVQSTLSRGGLMVFAAGTVGVVLASLLERPTKRRFAVLGGVTLVGCIGLLLTWSTIMGRFKDYGNEESQNTRKMLNISARLMLRDYPLGIGWNNFALTINHPYWYGDHIDHWQAMNGNPIDKDYRKGVVESLYYLLLSETGYQSLVAYVLLISIFLWWNVKATFFYRKRFLGGVSMGIFIGAMANYAQSFLERVLTQPRNMMLWFLILAVTARIEFWRRQEKKQRLIQQFQAQQESTHRTRPRSREREMVAA